MEYIVLGLLLLSDRTIYGLRDRIGKGLHLMYSSSMGSIQAAIGKLLRQGYIRYTEFVEKGRHKKLYSITESGNAYFQAWLNQPMAQENIKNPELAKIYFMGFAKKEMRIRNIECYLEDIKARYFALAAICEEGEAFVKKTAETQKAAAREAVEGGGQKDVFQPAMRGFSHKEEQDILTYQLAAARYGRDFLQFHIAWYEKLLLEIQGKDGSL